MTKVAESAIELLGKQGYQYIYAPSIASNIDKVSLPLGKTEERII